MNARGRSFSRGGVGGPDPPRRRRFRGQYVRRRTPSGGGYRGGSFSDDRDDSSPPPDPRSMPGPDENIAPLYTPQYQNRAPQPRSRGARHHDSHQERNSYFNPYQQRQGQRYNNNMNNNNAPFVHANDLEVSENEYSDHVPHSHTQQQQQQQQQPPPPPPPQQPMHQHHHQQSSRYTGGGKGSRKLDELSRSFQGQKTDIDEMKALFSKLSTELDLVKSRVKELESTSTRKQHPQAGSFKEGGDYDQNERDNRRRTKLQKQREKKAARFAEKRAATSDSASQQDRQQKILNPTNATSTSDRPQESTSNHNPEAGEQPPAPSSSKYNRRKNMERDPEKRRSRRDMRDKPKVLPKVSRKSNNVNEDSTTIFNILDHAICDVTSATKLSEIAKNLYQLLVSEDNTREVDVQQGFYEALNDISKRERDIVIDAPRYMDTLGRVLADCVILMQGEHENLVGKFLNNCVESYCQENKAVLLASIMKAVAGAKDDQFAKEIWDNAHLDWQKILNEGTELENFLETHDVGFTRNVASEAVVAK